MSRPMRAPSPNWTAACSALGEAFDLLAEVFLLPGADARKAARELSRGAAFDAPGLHDIREALAELAAAPGGGLEVEYARLFLHGRPATAHPYESFYLTGSLEDPETLADLRAISAAAGVRPAIDRPVPLDHLGLELALLALLLHGLASAAGPGRARGTLASLARRLLSGHLLVFAAGFHARLSRAAPPPVFAAAGAALTVSLEAAADLLGALDLPPSMRHRRQPFSPPPVRRTSELNDQR